MGCVLTMFTKADENRAAEKGQEATVHENLPSALANFDNLFGASTGKCIIIFLDYDGTLTPIVQDPEKAFLEPAMRDVLASVASKYPTSIVTGRSLEKAINFVKLDELFYAGSHGMDIMGPRTKGKKPIEYQAAPEFIPIVQKAFQELNIMLASVPGAGVENNKYCVSAHYRRVERKNWDAVEGIVTSVLEANEGLKKTRGHMVIELRPDITWNKGEALKYLMGVLGRNDVFPVYIGDDVTDEDAFKVLRDMGMGAGILVSKTPKETNASYSLSLCHF